jgi:epoxide hydrolase
VASPEAGAIAVLRSSGKREGNDRTDAAGPAFVRPFTVSIPDAEIDDLKMRLARTRWPDPETVGDWSGSRSQRQVSGRPGTGARGYDWRRLESELNRLPQFLTEIDGLDIHFIHVRSHIPARCR